MAVTVIGAAGRMGSWFTNFLIANGYEVIACDKNVRAARELARKNGCKFEKEETSAAKLSEIVILATPTLITNALLKRLEPYMPRTTLLVEISSSKEPLRETIKQITKRKHPILSIHPMFGHGARTLAGRTILVALRPRQNRLATKFLSTLRRRGERIIQTDLASHDRFVAATLALPHFLNFAMVNTLNGIGMTPGEAREVGGTTFRLQMLIAEALYHERLSNEVSILTDNEFAVRVLERLAVEMNRILGDIKGRQNTRLLHNLKDGASYVRKDVMFSSAYDRFNAAVEASAIN